MTIEDYAFGRIRIDGREYTDDVIIFPDHVHSPWWRAKGHELAVNDIDEILASPPRHLIIGSGYLGRMRVPEATRQVLREKDVKVQVLPTQEAVVEYNRLAGESADVVAALHLTC